MQASPPSSFIGQKSGIIDIYPNQLCEWLNTFLKANPTNFEIIRTNIKVDWPIQTICLEKPRLGVTYGKKRKVSNKSMNCQFSNFKWTVLRAPWTDSNDQGRKMTALASTFRRFWSENRFLDFWSPIFEKTDFFEHYCRGAKSRISHADGPYGDNMSPISKKTWWVVYNVPKGCSYQIWRYGDQK